MISEKKKQENGSGAAAHAAALPRNRLVSFVCDVWLFQKDLDPSE